MPTWTPERTEAETQAGYSRPCRMVWKRHYEALRLAHEQELQRHEAHLKAVRQRTLEERRAEILAALPRGPAVDAAVLDIQRALGCDLRTAMQAFWERFDLW